MIRTLSVSLLAVAAVVTGLLVNRTRQTAPTSTEDSDVGVADAHQLEALREAGI